MSRRIGVLNTNNHKLSSFELLSNEEDFVQKWIEDHVFSFTSKALDWCILYMLVVSPVMYVFMETEMRLFHVAFHLTIFLVVLLFKLTIKKKWYQPVLPWIVTDLIFALGFFVFYQRMGQLETTTGKFINGLVMYPAIFMYIIAIMPTKLSICIPMAMALTTFEILGYWSHPNISISEVSEILIFGNIFATVVNIARYKGLISEAKIERESRIIFESNEKLAMENLEKELQLANAIQDSFLPPPELVRSHNFVATYFQQKFGSLGGDWMALRVLPNGDLVGMVVDVTGKGISASLVVHAAQSLWVNEFSKEQFDPENWLRILNYTLLKLGEKTPQTMTIGIVVVSKHKLRYYSCGHTPLFIILGTGQKRTVRSLVGRGSILGLDTDIKFRPLEMSLEEDTPVSIFLGSDGVFTNGTRTSQREVQSIFQNIWTKGRAALADIQSNDDKTLLWIRRVG